MLTRSSDPSSSSRPQRQPEGRATALLSSTRSERITRLANEQQTSHNTVLLTHEHAHESMSQPSFEQAAPGSPLFGLGELEVDWRAMESQELMDEQGGCGDGNEMLAALGAGGESSFPFFQSSSSSSSWRSPAECRLSLREIFPTSPPYTSDVDEEEEVDDFAVLSSSPSCGTPSLASSPSAPPESSSSAHCADSPLFFLPAPSHAGTADLVLLNELLTSHGQEAIRVPPSSASTPSFPTTTAALSDFMGAVPAPPPAPPANPHDRALQFDAQLGSPLFGSPLLDLEPEFEHGNGNGKDFSYAAPSAADLYQFQQSPAFFDNVDGGSPFLDSPYYAPGSVDASPCFSDVGVVSPQQLELGLNFGGGAGGGGSGLGMSPAMEGLSLFGSLGVGSGSNFSSHDENGAVSSGAFENAHQLPHHPHQPDDRILFSPVVSPRLVPTPSPQLNDVDVSPHMLPAPLTKLPALPPAPPTALEEASTLSADEDVAVIEEEDKDDADFVPGPPSRSSAAGPTRSSSRRTTSPSFRKNPSSSPAPAPPLAAGLKVALDAPITSRTYSVDSRTAAKRIPVNVRKQMDAARRRGEVVDEEEFVRLADEKRRKNTMSARESRAKKAAYVGELEERCQGLEREREGWRGEKRKLVEEVEGLRREVKRLKGE
ncbi:hypothetical protein JCM8547_009208 [Rhodosporidiobolus lusitaniae]